MHQMRRATPGLLSVVLLGGLLSIGDGCTRTSAPAGDQAARSLRDLPALPLRMSLPISAALAPSADGVRIELRPGTRSPRAATIAPSNGTAPSAGSHVRQERPGLRIQYELKFFEGAGSGGDEQTLEGVVEVDGQRFRISCHDQAEAPAKPDAEWCIPWLATLQLQTRKVE